MKAKSVSPSKKKAGSDAKRKPASIIKKKVGASAQKKKPVAPSRGKPVSMAKKKLEFQHQVAAFAGSSFKGKRAAYFVLDTERTKEDAYRMCFAIEGEAGFYKLDWSWHCSFTKAKAETALMNKKLGLNEEEVNKIIISTMGPPVRRKK